MKKPACPREYALAAKLREDARDLEVKAEDVMNLSASERANLALRTAGDALVSAHRGRCDIAARENRSAAGLIAGARRWLKRGTPTRRYARREDEPADRE